MQSNNSSTKDVARFRVSAPAEIERILRKMLADQTLVMLYGSNERDSLLTALAGINMGTGYLYFDCGPNEDMNAALFASPRVNVTATMNQVRIQFTTDRLERAKYNGAIVFKAKIPTSVLRFQRREFYRAATSVVEPIRCWFSLPDGTLRANVADVSVGGLGVLYPMNDLQLGVGVTYDGCRLTLPGSPEISISLKVCSVYKDTSKVGKTLLHAGCQFVRLAPSAETIIQRYVFKVERERKSHT